MDGWRLDGRFWVGPSGERVVAISGGQELDVPDVSAADLPFPATGLQQFAASLPSAPTFTPPLAPDALTAGNIDWSAPGGDYGTATPPAPPGPGDGGSALSKFAKGLFTGTTGGKETTPSPISELAQVLGLGATGLGVANTLNVGSQLNKQTEAIHQGEKTARTAAAPAVAFGTDVLNTAAKGDLPAPMQAQIDQWVQQKKADVRARYASMGLGNSSDITQEDARIDQAALALKGQMLAQQESTGLEALQTGVSAGTGVLGPAQAQQQTLTQLISQADAALASMGAKAA
jgi:hypothetical protein